MEKLITLGKITAWASFVIGTILLSFYLYFETAYVLETYGIIYIVVALTWNSLMALILVGASILHKHHRLPLLKTVGLLLLNLPVATAYFYLILMIKFPSNL